MKFRLVLGSDFACSSPKENQSKTVLKQTTLLIITNMLK
jgi:hypothetical protein